MSNPYHTPATSQPNLSRQTAANEVAGPAISLIIASSIGIFFGILGLIGDAVLITTGMVEKLEQINDSPVSEYTQIAIRSVWGIILLIAAFFVLFGAIKMKRLNNYAWARSAAIVSMIPCLGPCCLMGIPFGIWAFVVLGKPHVQQAFR